MTIQLVVGKVNFVNLSRYSELSERTYCRQFEQSLDFMSLNHCLIETAIASERFQVAAIDASFIPKSGKHTAQRAGLACDRRSWQDFTTYPTFY